MATCTLHRVETNLSCRTCGTPVCPDCAVRPPMGGVSCAEHAGGAKKEAVVATQPRRESSGARGRMLVAASALVVVVAAGVVFLRPSDGGDSSSTSAGAWTQLPSAGLAARVDFSYVSTGRSMIVWGGDPRPGRDAPLAVEGPRGPYADGAAFDVATSTWAPLAAAPISGRRGHSAVWTGTHMIVFGGRGPAQGCTRLCGIPSTWEALSDGASYDPTTDRWSPIAPAPLAGRAGHSAVWVQNKMVVWGGDVQGGGSVADGASYDPVANAWTPLPPAPLEPRVLHRTVATAHRMLVWGGHNVSEEGRFTKYLADGAIYSPADNAWTPMAPYPQTTETPGRVDFSSVWTGTHMLVWGGYGFTEACRPRPCARDDGAAYDLNTNSWALMARSGLSARGEHRAVWTGKEMVVWGGLTATGLGGGPGFEGDAASRRLNDGAAYNPADDTWSQLPDSPLLGRRGHAMVWVGEKMVVWGGDGRLYLPRRRRGTQPERLELELEKDPAFAFDDLADVDGVAAGVAQEVVGAVDVTRGDDPAIIPSPSPWRAGGPAPSSGSRDAGPRRRRDHRRRPRGRQRRPHWGRRRHRRDRCVPTPPRRGSRPASDCFRLTNTRLSAAIRRSDFIDVALGARPHCGPRSRMHRRRRTAVERPAGRPRGG